jgi:lipopolysaccharide export system permease protein
MQKLQRYILIASLGPFLAISIGLSLLAIFTQSLTNLDLLIERGQNPITVLIISALAAPQFMTVVAPIAIFATIIMVYGRLYSENELVVAFAGGFNNWTVSSPIIRLSAVFALLTLLINVIVQPYSHLEMRKRVYAIRTDIATTLVREGQFREPAKGITIYARKIDPGGIINGLMISDNRIKDNPTIYTAKIGSIVKIQGLPALSLREGTVQRTGENKTLEVIGFSQYVMQLNDMGDANFEFFLKPQDRFVWQLFSPDNTYYWDRTHKGELIAEGHRRFSSPLNVIACAFLGLFAIIGGQFSRRGFSKQVTWASIYMMILLLSQSALQKVYSANVLLNIIQYLVPIFVIWICAKKMGMFDNWSKYYSNSTMIRESAKSKGALNVI